MSWEHATDRALLWLGRCEDMIADLDSGMVDLLCTDPPWGVNYVSNYGKHGAIAGDKAEEYDARVAVRALAAKLSRGAQAYVFGPFGDIGAPFNEHKAQLIWDKVSLSMGDLTCPWSQQTEPIHFYTTAEKGRGGLTARVRQGNILRVQRVTAGNCTHPTEKPVPLWRMLIEASSSVGESVCDPYMGVGGCGVAAILAGRTFIGSELDPKYFELARARIVAAEALAEKAGAL